MSNATLLRAAVNANPPDWQARLVLADSLEEAGEVEAAQQERRIAAAIRRPGGVRLSPTLQAKVRGLACATRCPVTVVAGDSAPTRRGERGYKGFEDGTPMYAPGKARAAGYKVHWFPSTFRVEVGVLWLVSEGYVQ